MKTWNIDPDHSCAAFAVRHMMLAHVRGQFNPCELESPGSRRGRNAEFAGGRVLKGSHPAGGGSTTIRGRIGFDPENTSSASGVVEIEVSSINTGISKRDEHLLTADFFDQRKYPLITFKSSRIEFFDHMRCRVSGDLTMRGVTRAVTFEGEYAGPRTNPYGDELSIGFSAATTINREDFGMMWGSELMQGGGLVVGREVQLFLDVEADLAK